MKKISDLKSNSKITKKGIKYKSLAQQLAFESNLVKISSQEVLREFEVLTNDFV